MTILFIALYITEFGIGYIITNKIMTINNFSDKICIDPVLFIFRFPPFFLSLIFTYAVYILYKQ